MRVCEWISLALVAGVAFLTVIAFAALWDAWKTYRRVK